MTVEFDCEGCGIHVIAFGIDRPPRHRWCAGCHWASETFADPQQMLALLDITLHSTAAERTAAIREDQKQRSIPSDSVR